MEVREKVGGVAMDHVGRPSPLQVVGQGSTATAMLEKRGMSSCDHCLSREKRSGSHSVRGEDTPVCNAAPTTKCWRNLRLVAKVKNQQPCLGEGSYGSVWSASYRPRLWSRKELDAAVKVHTRFFKGDAEADKLAIFSSPHILRSFGACQLGYPDGRDALVMERADFDLKHVFRVGKMQGGKFAENIHMPGLNINFEEVLHDVLSGLNDLNRQGFVHRDIKPDNILFVWDPKLSRHRAVLGDLDFACANPPLRTVNHIKFMCHDIAGTRVYLPPEAFGGNYRWPNSHKRDIFSAALSLVNAVDGGGPWAEAVAKRKNLKSAQFAQLSRKAANQMGKHLRADSRHAAHIIAWMLEPKEDMRCTAVDCLAKLDEATARIRQ